LSWLDNSDARVGSGGFNRGSRDKYPFSPSGKLVDWALPQKKIKGMKRKKRTRERRKKQRGRKEFKM